MLQKGVKLAPTMAAAQANLGVVLQDVGRLDEAVDAFVIALHMNESSQRLLTWNGLVPFESPSFLSWVARRFWQVSFCC